MTPLLGTPASRRYGACVVVPPIDVTEATGGFHVHLTNFDGPFDLLLSLIAKHRLEVTELALSQVTDEFIVHIRAAGPDWDLGEATSFLVVAATLLDLKTARLLPAGEVDDEDDVALLEARDLLFARLLQYRAYRDAAALFRGLIEREVRRVPRAVSLEPRFASLVPDVLLGVGPDRFAALAAAALAPRAAPVVSADHIHAPRVSVREQAAHLMEHLRRVGRATFRALVADVDDLALVVGRFLALLELYRDGRVAFDQVAPLGDLIVRWVGSGDDEVQVTSEYDESNSDDHA
jgi:segregation and condensation protein A